MVSSKGVSWKRLPILATLSLAVAIVPASCFAQGGGSFVRSGSFEVGGFVGASYGVDQFRVMGGGNVTYAVNKWILPYAEYSYFPGIARSVNLNLPGITGSQTISAPLSDFHGGVHIRVPIRESPIVPYAVFGVGGLTRFEHTVNVSYVGADGLNHTIPTQVLGGTDAAINFGGGLRYYVNQRFGLRVEAKGYKTVNSDFTPVFGKVEFGFFYQLR